jgi:hypothetical protein
VPCGKTCVIAPGRDTHIAFSPSSSFRRHISALLAGCLEPGWLAGARSYPSMMITTRSSARTPRSPRGCGIPFRTGREPAPCSAGQQSAHARLLCAHRSAPASKLIDTAGNGGHSTAMDARLRCLGIRRRRACGDDDTLDLVDSALVRSMTGAIASEKIRKPASPMATLVFWRGAAALIDPGCRAAAASGLAASPRRRRPCGIGSCAGAVTRRRNGPLPLGRGRGPLLLEHRVDCRLGAFFAVGTGHAH